MFVVRHPPIHRRLYNGALKYAPHSLILSTTPELSSEFASDSAAIHNAYEKRWIDIVADRFEFDKVDSELFYQHSINITKTIFAFYRNSLLGKDEAVAKIDLTINQLLNPYR
jgi:hypothetical protein